MIEKFLKAKHWQIFLITYGLPFLIQAIMIPMTIMGSNPMIMFKIFPIMMILFIGGFFGWFWSVAIGLQQVIPDEIKLNVRIFKIFFLIPLTYIIFIFGLIATSFFSGGPNLGVFAIIVVFHLFSMFCIFYCLYFVAKTFKTAELQRKVTFGDYAGEFFMIWFFPIGIWIVQPKINKMIANKG